jgi:hypothetical protein
MSLLTRLAKLEAQRSAQPVYTHYDGEPFAVRCGTGERIALDDLPAECTLIRVVYASMNLNSEKDGLKNG